MAIFPETISIVFNNLFFLFHSNCPSHAIICNISCSHFKIAITNITAMFWIIFIFSPAVPLFRDGPGTEVRCQVRGFIAEAKVQTALFQVQKGQRLWRRVTCVWRALNGLGQRDHPAAGRATVPGALDGQQTLQQWVLTTQGLLRGVPTRGLQWRGGVKW